MKTIARTLTLSLLVCATVTQPGMGDMSLKEMGQKAKPWAKIALGASTCFFHTFTFLPAVFNNNGGREANISLQTLENIVASSDSILGTVVNGATVATPYAAGITLIASGVKDLTAKK